MFLENILSRGDEKDLKQVDKVDIYTTLFEMYLGRARESKNTTEREEWESKAKKIIESKESLIDTSNVLLLSHLSNFRDGTVLVREKQGLRFDIFRSCTSAGDTAGALSALRKYGAEEPQLYTAALAYFTSSPNVLEEVGEQELENVLKKIDELGLMKPLQVVQTLSANAVATVGMVKKYLGETIERERREIQTVSLLIRLLLVYRYSFYIIESQAHRKLPLRNHCKEKGNRTTRNETDNFPGAKMSSVWRAIRFAYCPFPMQTFVPSTVQPLVLVAL